MTNPQPGDRVKVTFEGVINAHGRIESTASDWMYGLDPKDITTNYTNATVEVIEKATPIPQVGDVITTEAQYAALPEGSVVDKESAGPLRKNRASWGGARHWGTWVNRGGWADIGIANLVSDEPSTVLRVGWTYTQPASPVLTADDPEPPDGSVVLSRYGSAYQHSEGFWVPSNGDKIGWPYLAGNYGPVTLIHRGDEQ